MEAQITADLAQMVHEKLAVHGIDCRVHFANHPYDVRFNDGRHVELRAIRRGRTGQAEFVRIMAGEEVRRRGTAAAADRFCEQALTALANLELT